MDFLTIPRGHCLMDNVWGELLITSNNRACLLAILGSDAVIAIQLGS